MCLTFVCNGGSSCLESASCTTFHARLPPFPLPRPSATHSSLSPLPCPASSLPPLPPPISFSYLAVGACCQMWMVAVKCSLLGESSHLAWQGFKYSLGFSPVFCSSFFPYLQGPYRSIVIVIAASFFQTFSPIDPISAFCLHCHRGPPLSPHLPPLSSPTLFLSFFPQSLSPSLPQPNSALPVHPYLPPCIPASLSRLQRATTYVRLFLISKQLGDNNSL